MTMTLEQCKAIWDLHRDRMQGTVEWADLSWAKRADFVNLCRIIGDVVEMLNEKALFKQAKESLKGPGYP